MNGIFVQMAVVPYLPSPKNIGRWMKRYDTSVSIKLSVLINFRACAQAPCGGDRFKLLNGKLRPHSPDILRLWGREHHKKAI